MANFDFAPLYRSTVGFDRVFDLLDNNARPDWPPYNIERMSENDYRITMAVAGFGPDDIELTQNGNSLLVVGQRKGDQEKRQLLHHGIAHRQFRQTFNLADYVKVAAATMENGMLSIDLVREIPEQLKPRKIQIGSSAPSGSDQTNAPREVEMGRKAA